MKPLVIAIDGPAASGKSSTARLVARALGFLHIDSGAMYRAVTFKVLRSGVDPTDEAAVVDVARATKVALVQSPQGIRVFLDDKDVTSEVRAPDVTRTVSSVSSYPGVREVMVRLQRSLAAKGGVVLEGRDIGTVVLPSADLKIFMIANVTERARRRKRDLASAGIEAEEDALVREIAERDHRDATRAASPMKKADDAVEVDTSNLTIEEQVDFIVKKARAVSRRRS